MYKSVEEFNMRTVIQSRVLYIACILVLLFSGTGATTQQNEIEKRINALLAKMTPEEKLGQLQQLDGHSDGKSRPEHLDLARRGLLGSTLNVRGAKLTNEL